MQFINRKIFVGIVLAALILGFTGGLWFTNRSAESPITVVQHLFNKESGKPANVDFDLFWQVWDSLNEKYVDKGKIDMQKLVYGAISGMVNSVGDPYTVFFEPATSKKFQEEISGSFGGVGMEIGKRDNIITVIAPIKNTPAFRAGIKTGDRILKIDAKSTVDLSVEEAVSLIRGPRGTKVALTVSSINSPDSRVVELVRETIKIPAVEWKMLDGHIAYMNLYSFNQNVDSEFQKAAQEILKSKADRLIVDLRDDPGGLLDSSINIAGWFLDGGSLAVSEDYGNGVRNDFKTAENGALKGLPTVLLLNGGSASASEILAGALHDNRGIKLVGQKSFGKGSVQELRNFNGGSSLKVTVAKWLTPAGISISEKGINPDVKVEIDPKAVTSGDVTIGQRGKDPQLDKAVEIVNNL